MLSRFKGCLVGAVVGDCIGAIYEGHYAKIQTSLIIEKLKKLDKARENLKEDDEKPLSYTDDTAMTQSVALSLIQKGSFDAADMAKRFAEKFFKEPNRGYGGNIYKVFQELEDIDPEDVFKPAAKQFNGSGSYGNGGAMRISPAPLFAFHANNDTKLQELVTSITRLTHTHHLAIHGAILVAHAIDQSLRCDTEVDVNKFIDDLITKLKPLEEKYVASSVDEPPTKKSVKRSLDEEETPYCAKLARMKEMLQDESLQKSTIIHDLGHDVAAVSSVPAAVLSFLIATRKIPKLKDLNQFEQTIIYAISLGGDTDTIATMAGAMAGALYGIESIPETWRACCESVNKAEKMAEDLFNLNNRSALS
ncbi:poly(ADP-ribose) glycohydrolase ARH3 [Biomphalaria pfeifferi]|uniref:ADP-ribosylhydrolase ARH3 n=1 Tax=Biomphalaria pfeifferi TaxID=112525 RepID=A0AAD8F948_BIOPF|nr:poly(ADP-ribose) glycohydrolase ARH3 [Biomphalaria pfeifferi]